MSAVWVLRPGHPDAGLSWRASGWRQCARGRRDSARRLRNTLIGPTIPQLYVKGEFVGGCDITREMFQSGELATMLSDAGVRVKSQCRGLMQLGEAKLEVVVADIRTLEVEAIVNAANAQLAGRRRRRRDPSGCRARTQEGPPRNRRLSDGRNADLAGFQSAGALYHPRRRTGLARGRARRGGAARFLLPPLDRGSARVRESRLLLFLGDAEMLRAARCMDPPDNDFHIRPPAQFGIHTARPRSPPPRFILIL